MSRETPAGWYPAPDASDLLRYWDGEMWTDSARPAPAGRAGPSASTGKPTFKVQGSELVKSYLEDDERVEAGFHTRVFRTSYFVATTRRILIIEPDGFRGHDVRTFTYDQVEAIGMSQLQGLVIQADGQKITEGGTNAAAMTDFVDFVRQRMPRPGDIELSQLPPPHAADVEVPDPRIADVDAAAEARADETKQPASSPPLWLSHELRKLGDLHTEGLLTDEEFAAAKARLLGL